MELTVYQVITPLVAFVAVTYAWNLVFQKKKTVWEGILWTLFWGSTAAIAIFPDLLSYLTAATGIKDRENAVFITFFAVIFFVGFYMIIRIEELEQRHTKLVRAIGLKNAEEELCSKNTRE